MHEAGKSMYGKRSFGPDIPVGWSVELWRNFDSIQKTEFPDEAMARAVFEHLAEGLPVRLARIAHRLDK